MTTATLSTTVVVKNEAELNSAIVNINQGSQANTIDVQSSFSLTQNTVTLTESMLLMSSNHSTIDCNGFIGLSISNGATVSLSMVIEGDVCVHDASAGTTLNGLTGGQVANLQNNANFVVPFGNTFTAQYVAGGAQVCGTLRNAPINAYGPFTVVTNTGAGNQNTTAVGNVNDVALNNEAVMIIQSGTLFHAKAVSVGELSSISPSGSKNGTLAVSHGLSITGQNTLQMPGFVYKTNVLGKVTLTNGGIYGAEFLSGHGGQATEINNQSGRFWLGSEGTWQVATYMQHQGELSFNVPYSNNSYVAPLLQSDSINISGGCIKIEARTFYIPVGFQSQTLLLMTATSSLSIPLLQSIVEFVGFPAGLSTTVSQEGNSVYLKIVNESARKSKPAVCHKA